TVHPSVATTTMRTNAGIHAPGARPGGARSVRHSPPSERMLPTSPVGESGLDRNRSSATGGEGVPPGRRIDGTSHGRFRAHPRTATATDLSPARAPSMDRCGGATTTTVAMAHANSPPYGLVMAAPAMERTSHAHAFGS